MSRLRYAVTWRQARPSDLSAFPLWEKPELLAIRYAQRRSMVEWPAATLIGNWDCAPIAIVGCALPKGGNIELWAEFKGRHFGLPAIDFRIARACRNAFAGLLGVARDTGRAIVIWIDPDNPLAGRFASWLGFVPDTERIAHPITNQPMGVWKL